MSNHTIVTAYYKLTKSKHGHENYMKWMTNLLGNVKSNMVIFTDKKNLEILLNLVKECREDYLKNTIFVIKEFSELKMYNYIEDWEKQIELDPERKIHSKELYIIWNNKIDFIKQAANSNHFNSNWYILSLIHI